MQTQSNAMQSYLSYLLLALLGIGNACHCAMAQHQDEESASKILHQIGKHSFQGTFTYVHLSPQQEVLESFEGGKIAVQGRQSRLGLPGQEIINNGETVWTYLTEANEVQITDYDPEQGPITPWTIFANYQQHYKFSRLDTHQAEGHTYDSVSLWARDSEHVLADIKITVERSTKKIQHIAVP